jgi:hypothetical protein
MRSFRLAVGLISLGFFQLAVNPCWAFGSSGGDDAGGGGGTGGCCVGDLPKVLQESASQLRTEFQSMKRQELLDQQILGTICEKHNCGELTEEQASLLLERYFQEQGRHQDEIDKENSWWFNFLGAFSGIAGVVFGAIGLVFSWLAHKESMAAERQSSRNEVEISHLKDRPIGG